MGTYFISFIFSESKISDSYEITTKSYYFSEAGINEAIWKLKNDKTNLDGDDIWEECFTQTNINCGDCKTWSDTFFRNYDGNSTTVVSISNSECGRGEIIATTTIFFSEGKISQRVIKVKVFKAIGSLVQNSGFFSGTPSGETTINASIINVYNGNLLSNGNLNLKLDSIVSVFDNQATIEQEGEILSASNINLSSFSIINSSSTCAKNTCTALCVKCPADQVDMPAVDFDSGNPGSYKSKALEAQQNSLCSVVGKDLNDNIVLTSDKCVFTGSQFEDLLWGIGQNGKLILENMINGNTTSIYYVEGGIDLKGARKLEINGILLADATIDIGEKEKWTKGGQTHSGLNQITINDPGINIPSGLLTKSKMNFGPYACFETINITGLVYSQDETRINSVLNAFNITGGIAGRKISLNSVLNNLNIYLDDVIIKEGIWGGGVPPSGPVPFSPIVTIEHWEESY